jgi:hypothetical protein
VKTPAGRIGSTAAQSPAVWLPVFDDEIIMPNRPSRLANAT